MTEHAAEVDLLVVGGGINGTAIARDAAGRDLRVLLCEQGDLAQATSSASTKIIHGGIRYLEQYDFRLVRESLLERSIIFKMAPHFAHPIPFIMPHSPQLRSRWMIKMGMWLYDHLAPLKGLAKSKQVNFHQDPLGDPIRKEYSTGFQYTDGQTDDARWVVFNALDAKNHGADIQTYTSCIDAIRHKDYWLVSLLKNDFRYKLRAKAIVNAAGPWAQVFNETELHAADQFRVNMVKGSHIVVPKLYKGKQAYILQHTDRRVIIITPYEDAFTLIGTTDIHYHTDPAKVHIDDTEIDYLCDAVSSYFKKPPRPKDVVWSFSGVRPLLGADNANPAEVSREFRLQLSCADEKSQTAAPLLSVIGGKLTTSRLLAEQALDKLKKVFPDMQPAWTQSAYFPGAVYAKGDLNHYKNYAVNQYNFLPLETLHVYIKRYGTLAETFLAGKRQLSDMGLHFGEGCFQAEIDYLMRYEWAFTLDDIIWRRTKWGLRLDKQQLEKLQEYIQQNTNNDN